MKRPWTPVPWLSDSNLVYSLVSDGFSKGKERFINKMQAHFSTQRSLCATSELCANALLSSKAPAMAELLIEFIKDIDVASKLDYWEKVYNITERAKELLREIGYDPTVDENATE